MAYLPGLFNAETILIEQQSYYSTQSRGGDKGVHAFLKGTSPKVTVIEWLEFELAY